MSGIRLLRRFIKKSRKEGMSDHWISRTLKVSPPEIGRLMKTGYYPGPKIAAILGLPQICYVCKRRMPKTKTKAVTPKIGASNWEAFYFKPIKPTRSKE
jgi:hypothetical protein